ncbi:H-NS family nucleoid-associated regulatory protein [Paraburkholderia sp. GAS42]|uniref:H-NS family nucleoid-associated regulatory protein n=1 Tax=Paraburkholderia sp. GAS42 TaxID=3035135 RepID=UPI003D221184
MATTLEAMQAKIKKLQAQADALIAKQSSGVIEKIRELMAKHGLTTADIDAHAGGKQRATKAVARTTSKGSAAAVKYRDPKSGATWTGRGRAPGWIAAAKNRDKFLFDGSTAMAKPAPVSEAKAAGNYVRGPQPAMYQDPTSGATWSGRGRAPAWLAAAKDRSEFLIDGDSTAADAKPAVTKAVAKKAPTAKKTAARKAVSAKAPAKKAAAKNTVPAAVKKAPAKKAPRKTAAVTAPVATVESGAELTT